MPRAVIPTAMPKPQSLSDAQVLAAFIRAARTQTGMGIHEAAAFCGVSVSTLSKLEQGKGDVRLSSVLQVCQMLGVTITLAAHGDE